MTEETEKPESAAAPAAARSLDKVTAGIALGAVALLVVTALFAMSWRSDKAKVSDAEDAIAAASAEVTGLIGISSASSDADMKKLLSGATASFRSDLEAQAEQLKQALSDNEVEATGEVVSAGIVKLKDDKATVIVAATGTVKNKQAKEAEPRNYRLTVEVSRVKGEWLVSGLEFVS